jgi:hypothetical protein
MNTTTQTTYPVRVVYNDDFTGNQREAQVYFENVLIGTFSVYNGFVDFTNELEGKTYNLMEIMQSGAIINGEPKLD